MTPVDDAVIVNLLSEPCFITGNVIKCRSTTTVTEEAYFLRGRGEGDRKRAPVLRKSHSSESGINLELNRTSHRSLATIDRWIQWSYRCENTRFFTSTRQKFATKPRGGFRQRDKRRRRASFEHAIRQDKLRLVSLPHTYRQFQKSPGLSFFDGICNR